MVRLDIKKIIEKIASVNSVTYDLLLKLVKPKNILPGSEKYWIKRYNSGRNSGAGSYGKLAKFKAAVINEFVLEKNIKDVIEFGCGDGNQLKLAEYPCYLGFDVSMKAISLCEGSFSGDVTKTFKTIEKYSNDSAELALSLDVIFHLIEDNVFFDYMNKLFDSANKFVIIYTSDTNVNLEDQAAHVKHRKFTQWVNEMKSEWELMRHIPNKYPFNGDNETSSFCEFFIYEKVD